MNTTWIKNKPEIYSTLGIKLEKFNIRYMLPFFTYDGHICIDSNQMVNQKLQLAETNKSSITTLLVVLAALCTGAEKYIGSI
jgi:hypothetical protein